MFRLILIVIVVALILALLMRRRQPPTPLRDEIRSLERSDEIPPGLQSGDEAQDSRLAEGAAEEERDRL